MEYRVWQPASLGSRNSLQLPVPYQWVIGHGEARDKWLMVECNLLSWNDSMTFSFLSVVHNTGTPPLSFEYDAGKGLENGLHQITRRTLATGFNGHSGLVVSSYRNNFYLLDVDGRVGSAGQWPKWRSNGWLLAPRFADHPISYSATHGWVLEVMGRCPRHAALFGLQTKAPKTHKIYKFLYRVRTYWLWLDGPNALFGDNWDDPQVDTSGGFRLYVVDTTSKLETAYTYSGAETFFPLVIRRSIYYEELVKFDVMNGQLVLVTRIRNSEDCSKYRVYYVTLDHITLSFATRLRIVVPYGDWSDGLLDLSFSRDADKFCAKDQAPGLCARLLFYSLDVPSMRAASYQAVARNREAYRWMWPLGLLADWLRDMFRW
jgi:hypothetical protein